MKVSKSVFLLGTGCVISTLFLFQNCSPAKLSGDSAASSSISSSDLGSAAPGTVVDLNALLASASESPANVLYPSTSATNNYDYAVGSSIIENIVLRNNDFTKIEWVHGPSATVVASGDAFNQQQFSSDLLGAYYVFGYRAQTPFLIARFNLTAKGATTLGLNSVGAVQVTQSVVSSDSINESILLVVEAPAVDLKSVQFTLISTGQAITGKRAILITKKLAEQVDVQVNLSSMLGQTSSQVVSLPAKSAPVPAPAPAPAPTPTPAPTPAPAPIVQVSTTLINFGDLSFTVVKTRFITVKNIGNANMNLSKAFSNNLFYSFSTFGTCGSTLAPGASCSIGVVVTIGNLGALLDTLTITTNASNSPVLAITLQANGIF